MKLRTYQTTKKLLAEYELPPIQSLTERKDSISTLYTFELYDDGDGELILENQFNTQEQLNKAIKTLFVETLHIV